MPGLRTGARFPRGLRLHHEVRACADSSGGGRASFNFWGKEVLSPFGRGEIISQLDCLQVDNPPPIENL